MDIASSSACGRIPGFAAVPVVFLSALGDATSLARGNRLGVEHYLVKPFTAKQLLAVVSATLRRHADLRRRRGNVALARDPRQSDVEPSGIAPLDELCGGLSRGRVYLCTAAATNALT